MRRIAGFGLFLTLIAGAPAQQKRRVAVMNFDYEGDVKVLDVFLRKVSLSRYRMIPHGEGRFELETLRG